MKQPEYKCLVVDDEPIARRVIKGYLNPIPKYEVVGEFGDAFKLLHYLKQHAVDLLFLDIKMPGLNGLDFLRSLTQAPKVILITAYREFALEGFELDVVDYLLKPVEQSRFLRALARFEERVQITETSDTVLAAKQILVKSDRKTFKINLEELRFVESNGDNVIFHGSDQPVISKMKISDLADELPPNFIQTHRSFIVNTQFVKAFTSEEAELEHHRIPIGRSYKESAMKALRG